MHQGSVSVKTTNGEVVTFDNYNPKTESQEKALVSLVSLAEHIYKVDIDALNTLYENAQEALPSKSSKHKTFNSWAKDVSGVIDQYQNAAKELSNVVVGRDDSNMCITQVDKLPLKSPLVIILQGKTGVGKSHLTSAFAHYSTVNSKSNTKSKNLTLSIYLPKTIKGDEITDNINSKTLDSDSCTQSYTPSYIYIESERKRHRLYIPSSFDLHSEATFHKLQENAFEYEIELSDNRRRLNGPETMSAKKLRYTLEQIKNDELQTIEMGRAIILDDLWYEYFSVDKIPEDEIMAFMECVDLLLNMKTPPLLLISTNFKFGGGTTENSKNMSILSRIAELDQQDRYISRIKSFFSIIDIEGPDGRLEKLETAPSSKQNSDTPDLTVAEFDLGALNL